MGGKADLAASPLTTTSAADDSCTVSFGAVLRVREFRLLWLADIQSLIGDQLARVALSVLVFDRTHSGVWTALAYALTYLPAALGPALGNLVDRLPARRLLVTGDVLRAGLVASMSVPRVPLPVIVSLLVVVVLIGTPWKAAESALVADVLDGTGYALGVGVRVATSQAAQLVGFGAGGAVVAWLGVRGSLVVDAMTFAVSAAVLRRGLRWRPAAGARDDDRRGISRIWGGAGAVLRDPRLRRLVGLAWLAGLYVVPEGLAAPYAARLHGAAGTVGLILAAAPAGVLVGTLLYLRLVPEPVRSRTSAPLAALAGVPLVAVGLDPGLGWLLMLLALSGLAMASQSQVMADFVRAAPRSSRGAAIAFASSGLLAVQGLGLAAGGLVGRLADEPRTVCLAGACGLLCAVPLWIFTARATPARAGGRHRA